MMKKLLLLTLFFYSINSIKAQEVYFYTGKNFTTYDYKNSSGNSNSSLMSGSGSFYEVGYSNNFKYNRFAYSIGIAINEYNNVGSNSANSYKWDSQYIGAQGRLSYSYLKGKPFDVLTTIGLNASTIIGGNQEINGTYYDLPKTKEFTGLWITPSIGLQFKYNVRKLGYVSFGYNYSKGFNLSNSSDEKLSFNTNQIEFGIHFNLK